MKRLLLLITVGALAASPAAVCQGSARPREDKKYEASWASLDKRPIPRWYTDAKFGIFIHWGVYSVPSWGPKGKYAEWYWHDMQDKKGPTWKFHERVYGRSFPYQDFAPMFRAELFDPNQWADVFARSGARYVVLTSKHHEGFCLWPNRQANKAWGRPWNSVDTGPKRDLLGDLTGAVRARGLKMGFYYSLYEWYNPLYLHDFKKFRDEHFFPQLKDLVTRYKPAVIFGDGEWEHTAAEWRTPELLAWLYNDGGCGADLVVNDRWGSDTRGKHGGYYTTEYGGFTDFKAGPGHAWEENRGMGASYGYNRNEALEDYRSTDALVRLLVETVSQGGNLLLDIGPTADGRIPVIMQERLAGIGNWLKVNGDAIYGTTFAPFTPPRWGRMTRKGNKLYAVVFDWPKPGRPLRVPVADPVKSARLLRNGELVKIEPAGTEAVDLHLPAHPPSRPAPVIVLELRRR